MNATPGTPCLSSGNSVDRLVGEHAINLLRHQPEFNKGTMFADETNKRYELGQMLAPEPRGIEARQATKLRHVWLNTAAGRRHRVA